MVMIRDILKQIKNSALYGTAFFLMLNSVTTSFLGFIFWNIMARFFTPAQVGIGSTLVTGTMLLGNLSNMGLGLGLVRFVPEKEDEASRLVNLCFTITGAIALLVSLLYLAGIRLVTSALDFIIGDMLSIIPMGMSQSLFAAGSQKPQDLQNLARRSLGFSLLLSFVGLGAMFMVGGWFLGIFGSEYYENGRKLLWILSAAVIPQCINTSFLAINQVQKKVRLITAQAGLHAAIVLSLGVLLLKKIGPEGLAWGYLIAHLVVAVLVIGPLRSQTVSRAKGI